MRKKRILIAAALAAAFLLVAGIAVAAFISSQRTADSSFTAGAIGSVAIGNAATTALFDITDMGPGDSAEVCFKVMADNRGGLPAGTWKLYSGGDAGGTALDDHLEVTVQLEAVDNVSQSTGIQVDCSGFTAASTPVSAETLSAYSASTATFAAGDDLGLQTGGSVNNVEIRLFMELPNTQTVIDNAQGLTATGVAWVVENSG